MKRKLSTGWLKYLSISAAFVLSFCNIYASPLSPSDALRRVINQNAPTRTVKGDAYQLSHTETRNGRDLLYIFNNEDQGFIVTSADDRLPALVGYSDKGAFCKDDASPVFLNWMDQCAGEAEYLLENENQFSASRNAFTRSEKAEISPLVTTQWNQGAPFNKMCPEVDDTDRDDRHCLTGCLATAMAQILNYHKAKIPGKGNLTYQLTGKRFEGKLSGSFDYEGVVFDYDNMLDTYDDEADDIRKEAVAQLMYACGVSVHMQYTLNESGAYDLMVPYALRTYFGYSDGARYLERSFFSTEEWVNLIYDELSSGRPVIYSGCTQRNSGHAFVCDGYNEGLFHINWGWGGNYNGYFLLSILDPTMNQESLGMGYRYEQSVICGISPSGDGLSSWHGIFAYGGDLEVQQYEKNQNVTIGLDEAEPGDGKGFFVNSDPDPLYGEFYLKAVSETGDIYYSENFTPLNLGGSLNCCPYYEEQVMHDGKPFDNGFDFVTLSLPANLPVGKYKCYLGFTTDKVDRQDVLIADGFRDYVIMEVDESGDINFINGGAPDVEDPEIQKSRIKVKKIFLDYEEVRPVVRGELTRFNFIIENIDTENREYKEYIKARVYPHGSDEPIESAEQNIYLIVPAGIERLLPYDITFELEPGEYDMKVFDENDNPVSEIFTFTIIEEEIPVTVLILSSNAIELEEGDSFILTATIEPDDATYQRIVWTSSDKSVAIVKALETEAGMNRVEVWTLRPGDVEIKATASNGLEAVCKVKVSEKIVYAYSIYFDSATDERLSQPIYEGDEFRLVVVVEPEEATDKSVDWTTSDESIATIDAEGYVKVLKSGDVTLTATTRDGSNITASCSFYALSGITHVFAETGKADIFTIDGRLLKKDADKDYLTGLEKGIYILRGRNSSCTFIK